MSRKKQNIQKITALYCRLSLEDSHPKATLLLKEFY